MLRSLSLAASVAALLLVPAGAPADVTRSSVTSPANPTFRLDEREVKATGKLAVAGTSDGRAGDLVDLICTQGAAATTIATNVAIDKAGRFNAEVALTQFKPLACVLRAVPYKLRPKDLEPYSGPTVAVTRFDPAVERTEVRDDKNTVPMDYRVETGHLQAAGGLQSAGAGGLRNHTKAHPDLALYGDATWENGAALATNAIEVDGRASYAAANVPRFAFDGDRPQAPAGYDGVRATVALDERTGGLAVKETQRLVRCDGTDTAEPVQEHCRSVLATGVALERTVTFTGEHTVADVRDRFVSTDGASHRLRLGYSENAGDVERTLWRFAGEPAFAEHEPLKTIVPKGPGSLLVRGKGELMARGAMTYDPAPVAFTFESFDVLSDVVELTIPAIGAAAVQRTFSLGDLVIATEPPPVERAPEVPVTKPVTGFVRTLEKVRCRVPRVRAGVTLKAAKSALKKAGCKPGRTRKARSSKVRKGRVIALSRKAGTTPPAGAKIAITISAGTR